MIGHPPGIIERAFQLAEASANIDEIRSQLKREGYFHVDAHLTGGKIRSDLTKAIREPARRGRGAEGA